MSGVSKQGVIILGATSAMARATAQVLAQKGYDLVLAARDMEENELIAQDIRVRYRVPAHALHFDVEDFKGHAAFFAKCLEVLDESLEGVVLCTGYMEDEKIAEQDFAVARRTVDVNLTGSISILERAARWLEERQTGWLAVVSSVAGDRGRQSNYIYGASKAGLSAYCQGLRNRLYRSGVAVITIKPGFVDTKMTWGQVPFAASPDAVGKAIAAAIEKRKSTVYTPWFWRYVMLLIRMIPEWQFKRMRL